MLLHLAQIHLSFAVPWAVLFDHGCMLYLRGGTENLCAITASLSCGGWVAGHHHSTLQHQYLHILRACVNGSMPWAAPFAACAQQLAVAADRCIHQACSPDTHVQHVAGLPACGPIPCMLPHICCALCAASCVLDRDYDEAKNEWVWAREAPPSQKAPGGGDAVKKLKKKVCS